MESDKGKCVNIGNGSRAELWKIPVRFIIFNECVVINTNH